MIFADGLYFMSLGLIYQCFPKVVLMLSKRTENSCQIYKISTAFFCTCADIDERAWSCFTFIVAIKFKK